MPSDTSTEQHSDQRATASPILGHGHLRADRLLPRRYLRPPRAAAHTIGRPRLLESVIPVEPGTLTAILGWPGSGRTTLMTQAFERVAASAVWVSFTTDHPSPGALIEAIDTGIASLATADSSDHGDGNSANGSTNHGPDRTGGDFIDWEDRLDALIEDLNGSDDHLRVFIDDAHLLNDVQRHQLSRFVRATSESVSVVLSAVGRSPIPMSSHRLRGQLQRVRQADINFSYDEFRRLAEQQGLEHPIDITRSILRRSAGWVAGSSLLLQAAADSEDPLAEAADGPNGKELVEEYFQDVFFDVADEELLGFTLDTGDLPRFNAPFADAVRDRTDSAKLIEELEYSGFFLERCSKERNWHRYQRLFGEALGPRRGQGPTPLGERRHRAGAWLRNAGLSADVLLKSVMDKDHESALDTLRQDWSELLRSDHLVVLIQALSSFHDNSLLKSPPIEAAVSLANALAGEVNDARQHLKSFEATEREWSQSLLILRAVLAPHGAAQRAKNASAAYEREEDNSPRRSHSAYLLASALVVQGETDRALELLDNVDPTQAPLAAAAAKAELTLLALAGDIDEDPVELAKEATELMKSSGAAQTAFGALILATVAWANADNAEEARQRLGEADELVDRIEDTMPLDMIRVRWAMANAYLELADPQAAQDQLDAIPDIDETVFDVGQFSATLLAAGERAKQMKSEQQRSRSESFTDREVQILRLLQRPLTTKEIGEELYLSVNTIKTYLRRIYRKLEVSSRRDAVHRAIATGLVPAEPPSAAGPHATVGTPQA